MDIVKKLSWNKITLERMLLLSNYYDIFIDGDKKAVILIRSNYKWNEF